MTDAEKLEKANKFIKEVYALQKEYGCYYDKEHEEVFFTSQFNGVTEVKAEPSEFGSNRFEVQAFCAGEWRWMGGN